MTFSHSAGEKNILQSVLLSFFSVFIFSVPSKVILIVIEFMFLGINMFWALIRLILARAKMSLIRAQNIFMPANINSIFILFGNCNWFNPKLLYVKRVELIPKFVIY